MAADKRPPLPVILVANDLLDGEVVFAAADGFTRDPRQARIAADDAAADALLALAAQAYARSQIVDAYLVDVEILDGAPVPRHYREKLRLLGPSHRPDLGKQADLHS
jgi:L-aminopeptidase/D-esterase-like protein